MKLQTLPDGTSYRHVTTLQDNHRYRVDEIEQYGERRILKRCNDPALRDKLFHDVQSSFYLEAVRSYNIESVFRVRKIYSYGEGWYIGEKLHGTVLYERESTRPLSDDLALATDLYAPFIYETSIYTPQVMLGKYPYRYKSGRTNQDFTKRIEQFDQWLRTAVDGGFLQQKQAERIRRYVVTHLPEVRYGVELYDLEPWEMFVLPEYKIGVIDLEYLNLRGHRHFDAAYNYLRLWLDVKRPPVAQAMLRRYTELCGSEDMDGAFLSQFGLKLAGYLRDAALWMKDSVEKGKPVIYSHQETKAVLDRYLKFDIKALYED